LWLLHNSSCSIIVKTMNFSCSAAPLTGKELHTRHCYGQNKMRYFAWQWLTQLYHQHFNLLQEFQTESSYLVWSALVCLHPVKMWYWCSDYFELLQDQNCTEKLSVYVPVL
jgi:hypothetical protein